MWELIRANKRSSILLLILMAAVLMILGFVIGLGFLGPRGGMLGLIIATAIWLILTLISFSSGDAILLAASKAKLVTH
ncbi:MAG: peptidase M28, partial [Planctomycetes bacterium]|nr:peptidase M28 [Planctomycetota bacterium]